MTLAELGEYSRASSLLEELIKVFFGLMYFLLIMSLFYVHMNIMKSPVMQKKPSDPDVYRFLGGVKYGLKDYEGSAAAFRMSATVSSL